MNSVKTFLYTIKCMELCGKLTVLTSFLFLSLSITFCHLFRLNWLTETVCTPKSVGLTEFHSNEQRYSLTILIYNGVPPQSESSFRLHSLCIPQGGGGEERIFEGDLKFLAKDKSWLPKFLTEERGVANLFFSIY